MGVNEVVFYKTVLKEAISVGKIVTIHYFEFTSTYIFEGEKHDFWELLYVDKGEVDVMANTRRNRLKHGQVIFHKPNEFHNVMSTGNIAPNLVVIAFECKSPSMAFFEDKVLSIGDKEKALLGDIVREAENAFSSPLGISELKKLKRKNEQVFACEQLIKISLEHFLISLVRKGNNSNKTKERPSSVLKIRSDDDLIKKVMMYLSENLSNNISLNDICIYFGMSKTSLKTLFRKKTNKSVMEIYRNLRIEEAKKIIREQHFNFSEISEQLGYPSIHSFSRQFKSVTDMTPSEYASSVKVQR